MSVTTEMAMPYGNATDGRAEDQHRSEVVIKAQGAMERRGTVARGVVENVRQAWLFALAPTPVQKLLDRLRNPTVPGDNAALKLLYRVFLVSWAIPLTLAFYGLASAQQHPSRAVVVNGVLVGLAVLWLS
ncbi:hypothetical protein [Micromonospora sp. NPDC047730]|uniref:hypothetical protein n=1 Tax=Micromonospora sp. NPDC047730 TaxID=3364253 RepID=UPI003723E95A